MTVAERELSQIGFGERSREPECWRVTRLDGPACAETGVPPERSRASMRWRVLLARNCSPSPYRITRVGG